MELQYETKVKPPLKTGVMYLTENYAAGIELQDVDMSSKTVEIGINHGGQTFQPADLREVARFFNELATYLESEE